MRSSVSALQARIDLSPRMQTQRRAIDAAFGRGTGAPAGRSDGTAVDAPADSNGMPSQLRAGVESLSGMDLSDVRVHRDSDKPAQLNALAYAQGNDIHLGPGQEQHLPHEAWHVVQQRQGRVSATMQMAGVAVNDEAALEAEADSMGAKAASQPPGSGAGKTGHSMQDMPREPVPAGPGTVQRRETERQRREKTRLWSEHLQSDGRNQGDADMLAAAFANSGTSIAEVKRFAGLLGENWTVVNVIGLLRRFQGVSGGRAEGDWLTIARVLIDQPAETAAFARLPLAWTTPGAAALAELFRDNAGALDAAEWAAIAAALPGQEDDVAVFARMAGWNVARLAALAALFATDAGGLSAAEWRAVAANLPDAESHVAAFCRLAGWTPGNQAALAGLFAANAGALTAVEWCAVGAHLPDLEADVAALCRIAAWTPANLATLAGLFAADAGGQSAAQWAAIAAAHVNFADEEVDIATLARIAAWAAADLAAMAVAGWAAADMAAFATQAIAAGTAPPALQAIVAEAGFAASSQALVAAGWTAAHTGTFVAGAIATAVAPNAFAALLARAGFAAAALAMITANWTHLTLGGFLGQNLASGVTGAALHGLMTTAGFPASSRAMVVANWLVADLSTFTARVLLGGVASANLQALLATAGFAASSQAMSTTAGWSATQFGNFVAAAMAAGLAAAGLQAQIAAAGFAATSAAWLGAGWTDAQLGEFVSEAHVPGIAAARLQTFMAAAGSAAACAALIAAWAATSVGRTVGHCLTRAGPPDDARMVLLLQQSLAPAFTALALQTAATAAGCGAPPWPQVTTTQPSFSQPIGAGSGNSPAPATFNGLSPGTFYRVQLSAHVGDVRHFEQGHSYEHFLFNYGNCVRHRFSNMFAVGTDVSATVGGQFGGMNALADRRAWGHNTPITPIGAYRVGILGDGPPFWVGPGGGMAGHYVYPVHVTQFYPSAGLQIEDRTLVAIGRWRGLIP